MAKLRLTLGCWSYDRTRALQEGRIQPDGIELIYLDLPVEETFFRMLRHREFDVAEMSLSSYTVSLFAESRRFVAIPVFPSRFFRHGCIYVHTGSGVKEPRDLVGKKVASPEYQMTAPVWIRGILSDEYQLPVDSVTHYTGGEEEPGRPEKIRLDLPPNIKVKPIGPTQTLSAMLASGELDALFTARQPSTYDPRGKVKRLFENYAEIEKAYYRRTRIFPIMHTIVIRRELYEQYPWIAMSLYKAFCAAQKETYEDLASTAALKAMLPWLTAYVEEARREMGDDYWPYGFAPNRDTLATFLRYHHEQGLSRERLEPEALFAPETLESFKI